MGTPAARFGTHLIRSSQPSKGAAPVEVRFLLLFLLFIPVLIPTSLQPPPKDLLGYSPRPLLPPLQRIRPDTDPPSPALHYSPPPRPHPHPRSHLQCRPPFQETLRHLSHLFLPLPQRSRSGRAPLRPPLPPPPLHHPPLHPRTHSIFIPAPPKGFARVLTSSAPPSPPKEPLG